MTTPQKVRAIADDCMDLNGWSVRTLKEAADQLEWALELLAYVRNEVTVEVAAYGNCDCDETKGECPCPYCASIHFNERTDKDGRPLQALNPPRIPTYPETP